MINFELYTLFGTVSGINLKEGEKIPKSFIIADYE